MMYFFNDLKHTRISNTGYKCPKTIKFFSVSDPTISVANFINPELNLTHGWIKILHSTKNRIWIYLKIKQLALKQIFKV